MRSPCTTSGGCVAGRVHDMNRIRRPCSSCKHRPITVYIESPIASTVYIVHLNSLQAERAAERDLAYLRWLWNLGTMYLYDATEQSSKLSWGVRTARCTCEVTVALYALACAVETSQSLVRATKACPTRRASPPYLVVDHSQSYRYTGCAALGCSPTHCEHGLLERLQLRVAHFSAGR